MKCGSCGTENADNAAFCTNCGMPFEATMPSPNGEVGNDDLTKAMDFNDEPTEPIEDDNDEEEAEGATTLLTSELRTPGVKATENTDQSESNTTVLTSELRTPGVTANQGNMVTPGFRQAPQGNAQQGMSMNPMQPGQPPMQPGMQGMQAGTMQNMQLAQPDSKKGKEKKAKETKVKEKKEKAPKPQKNKGEGMSTGTLVYIIVSIVLILGFAGAGTYFYLTHTKKIDNLNKDVASLTDANADYQNQVDGYETQVADYETQIAGLNDTITADSEQIASLQEDVNEYAESSDHYAAYNGLISYADTLSGSSNSDFFCSDSVLHMGTDPLTVYVYVSENSDMNYTIDNTDIATCEWQGWANSNVATLTVTPGATIGNTTITLTNAANEETVTIYVYNN